MPGSRTHRVLVVDDEPMIRQLVADCLTEAGYVAITAANGSDALRALHTHKPDLVVLDLMMPVLDAQGFVYKLRKSPRYARVPILVMTATYDAREEAARLGAQGCVVKPFELDDLLNEAARLIGQAPPPPEPEHVRTGTLERSYT